MNKERLERYSLTGPENQAAVAAGLAGGDWFRSAVPRKRMKELMRRSDYPAIRDTIIWLGLMGLFAGLGIAFWGSWRALPFFLAYGLLYGSTSDSRWHEAGHGTAFKTRWMDQGLYQLASFMIMRDPTTWRWSHTRHHTDTLIVGRDPEIAVMRPARLARLLVNVVGLVDVPVASGLMFRHHPARRDGRERAGLPAEHPHGHDVPPQPVPVLEHELPRRAPHVPDGPVLPAARTARGGQGGPGARLPLDLGGVPGDRPGGTAPAAGPGVLRAPGPAAGRHAVPPARADQ